MKNIWSVIVLPANNDKHVRFAFVYPYPTVRE